MSTNTWPYQVGDLRVYRARDYEPSKRAEILSVTPTPRSAHVEVRFLDEPDQPVTTVPGSKLRARWEDAESYEARMANWQRIDDSDLDEVEESCLSSVYESVVVSPSGALALAVTACRANPVPVLDR